MTVEVKKKLDEEKSEQILSSLPVKIKPIDIKKYAGKLQWKRGYFNGAKRMEK